MASASARERRRRPSDLGGTLWLAAALFTATVCLAFSLIWLVDGVAEPTQSMVLLAVAAVASMVVASFADSTWSARRLGTVELGNATRLFAITSILFLIPTVLISVTQDDTSSARDLAARDLDAACPPGSVPPLPFPDVAVGSAQERTGSCLAWWGVIDAGGSGLAAQSAVTRAQAATLLDRVVRSAGEPLPPAPVGSVPADAVGSVHAPAIARLAASGIMGGVDDDRFDPGEAITRGQLSTLLGRAHAHVTGGGLPAAEAGLFSDVEGSVHEEAIRSVAVAGIAVGDGDTFSPGEAVTRGQLLTMLARSLDLWVAEHGVELPEP